MKKHIVCLGDSNTHGYCADPEDCAGGPIRRFNERERWTCLLQMALGPDYLVLEEGLPGRTTVFDDPLEEGLAAIDYSYPCLKSHEPVSLLVVMLGTNDTKERFGANAECISLGMERLIRKAMGIDCWAEQTPRVLIVSPPIIAPQMEASPVGGCMGRGCVEKSAELPIKYEALAARLGVWYHNAGDCALNQIDYMHLTKQGHAKLAADLSRLIQACFCGP